MPPLVSALPVSVSVVIETVTLAGVMVMTRGIEFAGGLLATVRKR